MSSNSTSLVAYRLAALAIVNQNECRITAKLSYVHVNDVVSSVLHMSRQFDVSVCELVGSEHKGCQYCDVAH